MVKNIFEFKDYDFGVRYADAHLSKVNLPDKIVERIVNWNKNEKNLLFFSGNPGVGKTYLCAALVKDWLEKGYLPRYLKERTFFDNVRRSIHDGWDYESEIKRICESRFFILDDIGSTQLTDFQKEVTFSFLDHRVNNHLPTVITSNLFLYDMQKIYSKRFISRIESQENTIIQLQWNDKRQELN